MARLSARTTCAASSSSTSPASRSRATSSSTTSCRATRRARSSSASCERPRRPASERGDRRRLRRSDRIAATPAPLARRIRPGEWVQSRASRLRTLEESLALTQTQLVAAVAEKADLSKAEAKRVLTALDEVVLEEIGNAQKVRIGGLVQLTVRLKPATKKRQGRNPATGEEITIAAKPASVDVRARPLAKVKDALPSVQKARRRLATKKS